MNKNILHLMLIFILLLFILYIFFGFRTKLEVTKYDYSHSKIPMAFEGYKIVQLSDFHCKDFGDKEKNLIDQVTALKPDLIVLTGDLIDKDISNTTNIEYLLSGLFELCPIVSVNGNHELNNLEMYEQLKLLFQQYQVVELNSTTMEIEIENSYIQIWGAGYSNGKNLVSAMKAFVPPDPSAFNILLFHGSNSFDLLKNFNYDLIFSGHTHGGLWRFPILGGLIATDASLFPKYDGGKFTTGSSTLISSRGLGDSVLPRFYNNPEIVLVTLHHSK